MSQDLCHVVGDESMRLFQWLAMAVCIVLSLIDGSDVLMMVFAASSVAAE